MLNHVKAPGSVSSHGHTSKGRTCKGRAVMKRQGGRRDSDGLPTSFTSVSECECQLENQVQQLKQQLREQEIENLLDLRQALGLLDAKERSKSTANLARIPTAALTMMRTDLVKILARLNSIASWPASSAELSRGDEPYIA